MSCKLGVLLLEEKSWACASTIAFTGVTVLVSCVIGYQDAHDAVRVCDQCNNARAAIVFQKF